MQTYTKRDREGTGALLWEAAGLRWLAAATGARIAAVVEVADRALTIERLTPGKATAAAAEDFGQALALTHAAGAEAFGSPPPGCSGDGWIGRQTQPMRPAATWGEFYAEQRVRPFVRRAVDAGNLDPDGARIVEAVCDRIAGGEFDDDRPPARLHGDLWAGNVIYTDDPPHGQVALIDPAAHGGHGQTDLAMLALFGCDQLGVIERAYAEAADLPADWPDRTALHQLHPMAVHAASHGPSYGVHLVGLARRYR